MDRFGLQLKTNRELFTRNGTGNAYRHYKISTETRYILCIKVEIKFKISIGQWWSSQYRYQNYNNIIAVRTKFECKSI